MVAPARLPLADSVHVMAIVSGSDWWTVGETAVGLRSEQHNNGKVGDSCCQWSSISHLLRSVFPQPLSVVSVEVRACPEPSAGATLFRVWHSVCLRCGSECASVDASPLKASQGICGSVTEAERHRHYWGPDSGVTIAHNLCPTVDSLSVSVCCRRLLT